MAEREPIAAMVGLGNPGPGYAATRHNVGFWLVDRLAARSGEGFREAPKVHGALARVRWDGHDLRLFKPGTYMNRSGRAVAALARYFKLAPEQLLVVHDDVDLPPGAARLKRGGGHGGHNGLRDIVAQLGTREFFRLRLGVGHPGASDQVVDYVLGRPSAADREAIEAAIDRALEVLPLVLEGGLDKAMQELHTHRSPP
ncbi:MAG: aminoacyl-tRNA hydrolase [Gammaproteobacteria bacterium]|nr:aminoacyl-tRNA hydrolase [Gammaproteobacteria bacterium]